MYRIYYNVFPQKKNPKKDLPMRKFHNLNSIFVSLNRWMNRTLYIHYMWYVYILCVQSNCIYDNIFFINVLYMHITLLDLCILYSYYMNMMIPIFFCVYFFIHKIYFYKGHWEWKWQNCFNHLTSRNSFKQNRKQDFSNLKIENVLKIARKCMKGLKKCNCF